MFSMFCVSLFSCHLADKDGHSLVIALYSGRILSLVGQGNLGKIKPNISLCHSNFSQNYLDKISALMNQLS